jgi:hypothetical protein
MSGSEGTADDTLPEGERAYPPVDFTTFILSIGTSAFLHLGEPLPGAPAPAPVTLNLPLARHTIDLLGMLEQKTRGNLSGDEERLLGQLLFDLRRRYVEKAQSSSP